MPTKPLQHKHHFNVRLRAEYLRLEKFVYEKGTNVALYNAEHSPEYQEMQDTFQAQIKKQITKVDPNDINTLMLYAKKAGDIGFHKAKGSDEMVAEVSVVIGTETSTENIDLTTYLTWAAGRGGQAALDKLGINGVFGQVSPELVAYFEDSENITLDGIDNTTKQWIADQIQHGVEDGLSPQEIAYNISEASDEYSYSRAQTIVLTETAKAMTRSELEVMKGYGVEIKTWNTSLDERVCQECNDLDDETVPINDTFSDGAFGPGDSHPDCRCFLSYETPPGFNPADYEGDYADEGE